MAKGFVDGLYYAEVRRSMAGVRGQSESSNVNSNNSPDVLDAIKRRLGRVQANIEQNYKSVMQGLGLPVSFKKKNGGVRNSSSSHSCADEEFMPLDWPYPENIEMEHVNIGGDGKTPGTGKGHDFGLCQLNNPTWCDNCGDFIWGVSKQCLRCRHCQYTCHHHCLTAVALDCTMEGTGGEEEALVSRRCGGSDLETSLSDPSLSKRTPTQKLATSSLQTRRSSSELTRVPGSAQPVSPQLQAPAVTPTPMVTLHPESVSSTPAHSPAAEGDSADSNSNEKDETDSGYRSGTIPDDKLPKHAHKAQLNCKELQLRLEQFNTYLPAANLELNEDGHSFQGFIKVNLNLIRPITMSLSAQPPSFYELLTQEHIVEQNTQSLSFYMPRDTVKSIHVQSTTTTREVITVLLKKFQILDHPRKFAMYEQEVNKTKIVKLHRVKDSEFPLVTCLSWNIESPNRHRLVLQENETGEIQWDAFSLPELSNFLRVLDREEEESIAQLKHKYSVMKRIMLHRLKELRKERKALASAHHSAS